MSTPVEWLRGIANPTPQQSDKSDWPQPNLTRPLRVAAVGDWDLGETFAELVQNKRSGIVPAGVIDLETAPAGFNTYAAILTVMRTWARWIDEAMGAALDSRGRMEQQSARTQTEDVYRKVVLGFGHHPITRESRDEFVAACREADTALHTFRDDWRLLVERLATDITRRLPCNIFVIGLRNIHLAPNPEESLQAIYALGHARVAYLVSGVDEVRATERPTFYIRRMFPNGTIRSMETAP